MAWKHQEHRPYATRQTTQRRHWLSELCSKDPRQTGDGKGSES